MSFKAVKLMTVPTNGQISIGKAWAGRQIRIEVSDSEIHISAGTFIPDSQKAFFTPEAKTALAEFNNYESGKPAKASDTKALFASLKKKKAARGG
ncbi:MAG: hypothetical protein HC902_13720 [Calothrix sp. SM1_5_4]|nr:hypothetical protein [Calothrix sp. SM1_5_4]